MLNDFLALSRIPTGVDILDADPGHQYLHRLSSTPFAPFQRQILEIFRGIKNDATLAAQVRQQILGIDGLLPTISRIILLGCTSHCRTIRLYPLLCASALGRSISARLFVRLENAVHSIASCPLRLALSFWVQLKQESPPFFRTRHQIHARYGKCQFDESLTL
jgi:hypothetical protein